MIYSPRFARLAVAYARLFPGRRGKTDQLMFRLLWRKCPLAQAGYNAPTDTWTFPLVLSDEYRVMMQQGMVGIVQLVHEKGCWTLAWKPIAQQPK